MSRMRISQGTVLRSFRQDIPVSYTHLDVYKRQTKSMVDELAENLKNRGISAEGLHGDMSQAQRDTVMKRFRSGNLQMLIATDVAARGIDVNDVDSVINYDVPQDIEYYEMCIRDRVYSDRCAHLPGAGRCGAGKG